MATDNALSSFDMGHIVLPVCGGTQTDLTTVKIASYLGSGFFIDDHGTFVTCNHVVEKLSKNETLYGLFDKKYPIAAHDLRVHPSFDFAVASLELGSANEFFEISRSQLRMGDDVTIFGYTMEEEQNNKKYVKGMMFKGSVVRFWDQPTLPKSRSTCEISCPVLPGLSGGPLLSGDPFPTIAVGMVYGNKESAITTHKLEEIEEKGERFYERIDRVIELGCAHTAEDILSFMDDLGVDHV